MLKLNVCQLHFGTKIIRLFRILSFVPIQCHYVNLWLISFLLKYDLGFYRTTVLIGTGIKPYLPFYSGRNYQVRYQKWLCSEDPFGMRTWSRPNCESSWTIITFIVVYILCGPLSELYWIIELYIIGKTKRNLRYNSVILIIGEIEVRTNDTRKCILYLFGFVN
jgi:hypothetical protein